MTVTSDTPIGMLRDFARVDWVPGQCTDADCGVDEETPYGCGGFGAMGTTHCTCGGYQDDTEETT